MAVLDNALAKQGATMKAVERWKDEMPIEQEMVPKDKYTIFDRKEKKYRKSIRSTFLQLGTLPNDILTFLQSCPNGRGFRNESILQDTDRQHWNECIIYQCTSRHGRRSENVLYHRGHLYEISTNQFSHI